MDVNNNVNPRGRFIRRRAPLPLEGYYYYLSLLKALVQFLSYILCMIIVAGIEIRIAEMAYSSPWVNRSQAHPPEQFFLNRMDEFLVHMDFFKLQAEGEGSAKEERELFDDGEEDEDTLLSLMGEDLEVVILPLTELRANNLTGLRANDEYDEDRMTILNM